MPAPQGSESFRFEVAFSFAGPHRDKVRAIAELVAAQVEKKRVFFDEWYEHEILGPNMRVLLQRIYYERSLMVVADVSSDYAARPWTQAEAEAIDALRMTIDTARDEIARLRLINIRFDDGEVPGVLNNTGWIDARKRSAEQIADTLLKRRALLLERMGAAAATPPPLLPPGPPPPPSPPILFFHPATNDDRYSRRERELAWLDDCARDTNIRIATVTGQGGLGKTALVGHWIEKHHGWQHRAFRGVFFYSFYSNRHPKAFFDAFLQFVCDVEKISTLPEDTPLHHLAVFACKKWSYLVVLDGLEVLQHGEDDPHYGWIADGELTEFVARVGADGPSLLVLTSRFPFPRITDEHPAAARALELPLFTKAEGADLLAVCGLTDPRPRLEGYSELLGGHPLALRIFAGACQEHPLDDPEKVSRDVRSAKGVETMPDPDEPGLNPKERQKRRQRRQFYKLLRWFQQKLSPAKRRLLQLVALFPDPVRTDTLTALALGLDAMKADFIGCNLARITGLLHQLNEQFLLQKETSAADDTLHWSAHPIVRDVCREAALAAGDTVAKQFAEIVAGKGEGKRPKTIAEVLPITEAIEVLLVAGDFKAADELYRVRLENGYVFQHIPAPQEGLRCARAFLELTGRPAALEKEIGYTGLAFYVNEVALWGSVLGEMDGVEEAYRQAASILLSKLQSRNVQDKVEGNVEDKVEDKVEDDMARWWSRVSSGRVVDKVDSRFAREHEKDKVRREVIDKVRQHKMYSVEQYVYDKIELPSNNPFGVSLSTKMRQKSHPVTTAPPNSCNISRSFLNIAAIQCLCGSLREATASACEALFYAAGPSNDEEVEALALITECRVKLPPRIAVFLSHDAALVRYARAWRANSLSLVGKLTAASRDFSRADSSSRANLTGNSSLPSIWGICWSVHRLRLGEMEAVLRLTENNGAICKRNGWNSDLARCDLLLGELDLLAADLATAERRIAEALRVFREARQGKDLPDALLAMARVRRAVQLAQKNAPAPILLPLSATQERGEGRVHEKRSLPGPLSPTDGGEGEDIAVHLPSVLGSLSVSAESLSGFTGEEPALSHCEEALRLAARSGFLLNKCDALNFHAQLLREAGHPDKALADAKEAHDIAQRCDYYWGLHEALRQLRDTAKAVNRAAEFREWDKAERDLTQKMQPEFAAALEINRQHDAEMERLYGKK